MCVCVIVSRSYSPIEESNMLLISQRFLLFITVKHTHGGPFEDSEFVTIVNLCSSFIAALERPESP